jgi:hypothetical protein
MVAMNRIYILIAFCVLLCMISPVQAEDLFIVDPPLSDTDKRNEYNDLLLREILNKTVPVYGPYKLSYAITYMERDRLLTEMVRGEIVNVTAQATRPSWEASLIPIRIPVDKGILSYRILLIKKKNQPLFAKIKTLDELKKLKFGVGAFWSSYPVFVADKFNVVTGEHYDGLFNMLMSERFDCFPRGINEAFIEYDDRKNSYPDLAVENSILIYTPLPKYYFVSPKKPAFAKRIKEGLEQMIRDGSFDRIFYAHHKLWIEQTNFRSRKYFYVPNPYLTKETPLDKKEYWFDISKGR